MFTSHPLTLSPLTTYSHPPLRGPLTLTLPSAAPGDIQNFIRVAFNVNLVQGYALTETCSAGTVQVCTGSSFDLLKLI